MRVVAAVLVGIMLSFSPAAVRAGDRAGDFDYYVLALSWTASWCRLEGDSRRAPECRRGSGRGFVLHGLWPQREADWPEDCTSRERDPSRAETAAMADVMPSAGLAWYQWKKHGRCSGLSPDAYFALARRAFASVRVPEPPAGRITPAVLEAGFAAANPGLPPEAIHVACRDGLIHEIRVCLTRALAPRACSASLGRECTRSDAALPPAR